MFAGTTGTVVALAAAAFGRRMFGVARVCALINVDSSIRLQLSLSLLDLVLLLILQFGAFAQRSQCGARIVANERVGLPAAQRRQVCGWEGP